MPLLAEHPSHPTSTALRRLLAALYGFSSETLTIRWARPLDSRNLLTVILDLK